MKYVIKIVRFIKKEGMITVEMVEAGEKKKIYKRWWFWVIIGIVILIMFSLGAEEKGKQQATDTAIKSLNCLYKCPASGWTGCIDNQCKNACMLSAQADQDLFKKALLENPNLNNALTCMVNCGGETWWGAECLNRDCVVSCAAYIE